MALVLREFIHRNEEMDLYENLDLTNFRVTNIESVDEEISAYYIYLDNHYKRDFNLNRGDKFIGEITNIGKNSVTPIDKLEGDEITFLIRSAFDDRIYFSKDSYEKLKEEDIDTGYYISVKIEKAVRYTRETEYGKNIEVFPRQKVEEP